MKKAFTSSLIILGKLVLCFVFISHLLSCNNTDKVVTPEIGELETKYRHLNLSITRLSDAELAASKTKTFKNWNDLDQYLHSKKKDTVHIVNSKFRLNKVTPKSGAKSAMGLHTYSLAEMNVVNDMTIRYEAMIDYQVDERTATNTIMQVAAVSSEPAKESNSIGGIQRSYRSIYGYGNIAGSGSRLYLDRSGNIEVKERGVVGYWKWEIASITTHVIASAEVSSSSFSSLSGMR